MCDDRRDHHHHHHDHHHHEHIEHHECRPDWVPPPPDPVVHIETYSDRPPYCRGEGCDNRECHHHGHHRQY
ncbi:hypothetical protein HHI36_014566 [Cryptolaemus montrouzieri]|uniref:Uncharacterized protein n=1 Tax=Cryptolaemus montrouzieri TaxID=559131 RepID=A0ABD2N3M0_9CUCU